VLRTGIDKLRLPDEVEGIIGGGDLPAPEGLAALGGENMVRDPFPVALLGAGIGAGQV
jgi:hypothetical protein